MGVLKFNDIPLLAEGFLTFIPCRMFPSSMKMLMFTEIGFVAEDFPTYLTGKGLFRITVSVLTEV